MDGQPKLRRIAVTGGPGAGKTSVWRALAREYPERVVAVPEVATALLAHVFPAVQDERERHAVQHAIFAVQQQLEAVHAGRLRGGQVLLCDRGTPDGAGYWPEGHAAFFAAMATSWDAEIERYDAVVFLETAAAGGLSIASDNATRTEDAERALHVDGRLREVWSRHPRCEFVAHERDFAVKIARGSAALRKWLERA